MSVWVQNCRPITTCWFATCLWKSRQTYTDVQEQEIVPNKVRRLGRQSYKKHFVDSVWALQTAPKEFVNLFGGVKSLNNGVSK